MKADPIPETPADAVSEAAAREALALMSRQEVAAPVPLAAEREVRLDRWLHGIRRRLALASLSRRERPSSLLFVCIGNLYRSPFAAAAFIESLPLPLRSVFRCDSAGFAGQSRPPPRAAIGAAARRGVDLRDHRSTLLSARRVAGADLIVVMDADQGRGVRRRFGRSRRDVLVLGDLDPQPIRTRRIADPWEQPDEVLEATYDRIERCVKRLGIALLAG